MDVVGPRRAGLLDERAEHALVARERAGVRGRGAGAGLGGAHLEDRHPDVALGGPRERAGEPRAVAVGLQEQRDRADVVLLDERGEQRGGVEDRLVADGRDGVEAQPAADGQRVDGHVAALGDQRDATRLPPHQRVAPQRRAAVERDEPVAVGAEDRQSGREGRLREFALQPAPARLGEAGREHDQPAAATAAGRADDLGHAGGRDRDDDGVDRLGQVLERRHAHAAVHLAARGMHAVDGAGEAERRQVAERRVAVGAGAVGRADHGDRPRAQQRPQVEGRRHRRLSGQRRTFATPRRSSERATMSRWISLVPSQMRSTRSSRRKRSATLSRR